MSVGQDYYKDNLKDKSFSEILETQSTEIFKNDAALKLVILTFIAKSTEEIVKTFDSHKQAMIDNSKSNFKLAKNVFWLNIILGIITILGTFFSAWALFSK